MGKPCREGKTNKEDLEKMTYDVKIYEKNGECETIRNLLYHQLHPLLKVLQRHKIKYVVKEIE